jgi:NADPH:quinone reductase-like Zn-dependent oxidoreductase
MKAIVRDRYGSPDVLKLLEIDKPAAADDEVLVRVRASSANPADWHNLTGTPYIARMAFGLPRPKPERLGIDFAGTVEAVGGDVKQFQPGDEVFGARSAAFAEYLVIPEDGGLVSKPANLTFEEAAAAPVAALTALQALRDHGHVQSGQKVLINGASGGVGTFAVQIAQSFGAEVTGVCSTRNVEMVREIGADHVIDYTREDFTRSEQRYDLMIDIAGNRSWSACKRVLKTQATFVMVGGPKTSRLIGPVGHLVKVRLAALRSGRQVAFFVARVTKPDMMVLRELLEAGKVKPIIDRTYSLSETADAFRYLEKGHARGKVVITV